MDIRQRLLGQPAAMGRWGWVAATAITLFGGILRLWHVNKPGTLVFDETYYVKQASSMLQYGYERRWSNEVTPKADELFAQGDTQVFQNTADFVVHPPGGKWMIALGEMLLGQDNGWGWRISSVVVGTLSIALLIYAAYQIFGSPLVANIAGLLLAVDNHHIVLSRTGLLDIFVSFWALLAFALLLADRAQFRRRLADRLEQLDGDPRQLRWLGVRWWRIAAAISLGMAMSVKWSGLYFLAAFGLMTFFWDAAARRAIGTRRWFGVSVLRDGIPAALLMVPLAIGTYLASWTSWFLHQDAYLRTWADQHPSNSLVPNALRSLWKYHQDAYTFHVNLSSSHPYESNPWSWSIMARPTAFYFESRSQGVDGCAVEKCASAITALGNPVIWWGGTFALLIVAAMWLFARDWRAGAVLAGLAGGYLPWFMFQDRTVYSFYAVAFVPYLVLALTYLIAQMLSPRGPSLNRQVRALGVTAIVVGAVLLGWWFYPVSTGEVIPHASWTARMWLPSWI